ncbi:MAG: hypothetical protein IJ728_01525 [Selenomonadaceae bacterium]|nr:hypothetical protein [Selenomonadaceae bacterium]
MNGEYLSEDMKEVNEMTAIEELGLTKEKFSELYKKHKGFNDEFNQNEPSRAENDSFGAFLERGSKKIVEENAEIIDKLAAFSRV